MKWRTNEEYPKDRELCFCEVSCYGKNVHFVLRFIPESNVVDQYWSWPGLRFGTDEITRWCPIKEIIALLNSETTPITCNKEDKMCQADEKSIHPDYYKGEINGKSIEVFDIIDQFVNGDFYLGNVLKYVCRAGKKSKETKKQDLEKAAHYIQEAIKRCENNDDSMETEDA